MRLKNEPSSQEVQREAAAVEEGVKAAETAAEACERALLRAASAVHVALARSRQSNVTCSECHLNVSTLGSTRAKGAERAAKASLPSTYSGEWPSQNKCVGVDFRARQSSKRLQRYRGERPRRGASRSAGTEASFALSRTRTTPESKRGSPKVHFPSRAVVFKSQNRAYARF